MLTVLDADNLSLPAQPVDWLRCLSGPTVVEQRCAGSNHWCVVSGLIHGNEPSGLIAIHRLLSSALQPRVNLALVVSSVHAARKAPLFSHRQLPNSYDLNRRFGVAAGDDDVTRLARALAAYIRERNPLWVLDLHNTSGSGPAFAVAVSDSAPVRQLALPFCNQIIITHLVVGSLMEQNFNCPVVTIECGGAADPNAHQLAFDGLQALVQKPFLSNEIHPIRRVEHPVRVVANTDCTLAYGVVGQADVDITLRTDIEQQNWTITPAGTVLGWLTRALPECLSAVNDHGEQVIEQLFVLRAGEWIARRDMQLFMATARGDIALRDCLFYVS